MTEINQLIANNKFISRIVKNDVGDDELKDVAYKYANSGVQHQNLEGFIAMYQHAASEPGNENIFRAYNAQYWKTRLSNNNLSHEKLHVVILDKLYSNGYWVGYVDDSGKIRFKEDSTY